VFAGLMHGRAGWSGSAAASVLRESRDRQPNAESHRRDQSKYAVFTIHNLTS
jgi:hypothetical protein